MRSGQARALLVTALLVAAACRRTPAPPPAEAAAPAYGGLGSGHLEEGAPADVVVVATDPLVDPRALAAPERVFLRRRE